jgi:hypothetical protein
MAETNGSDGERAPTDAPEFIYETFYAGAIGGSIVALLFLVVDAARGEPLFTPSLMGSVLFHGVAAADVVGVNMGAAAQYTAVHFASFLCLGAIVAFAVREAELHSRHPMLVMLAVFLVLEGGFALAATTLLPGVIEQVGAGRIGVANALAAFGMGLFITYEHRPSLVRGHPAT